MLVAFKNTTVTKPVILKQLRLHAKADEIAARSAAYVRMSNKLIILIKAAPKA